jgi:hypothetical protein
VEGLNVAGSGWWQAGEEVEGTGDGRPKKRWRVPARGSVGCVVSVGSSGRWQQMQPIVGVAHPQ